MDNNAFDGGENIVDSLRESGISHTAGERSQKPQAALDPARSSVYSISGKRELPGAGEPDAPGASAVHLRREMGLGTAVSIIVGTIIGSGIFISPKGIAEGSGSVGFSLVNWAICGVVSFCGALCMAELGTIVSKNGGDYMYLKEGLGDLPAFLNAQVMTIIVRPASQALACLTCATYIILPFFDDDCGDAPKILINLTAVVILCVLLFVNGTSVRMAARIQIIFTVAKVLSLCVIVVGGMVKLAQGNTVYLRTGFDGTETNIGKIAVGLYNGMYAYSGWANLNFVAGELKNPSRNIPLAIFIALPLVIVLYLLVNISYFTVMSIDELVDSPAVGITWANRVLGSFNWVIPIGVAMSTFGSCNGTFLTSGRVAYSSSREGHTLEIFSMVHVKYYTPLLSISEMAVIALILTIPSDVSSLMDLSNFVAWSFVALVMVSLIVMRFTKKDVERAFKVPIVLPILMTFVALFLVFGPFMEEILVEYLYSIAVLVFFFILYFPFVLKKYKLPGMDSFTTLVQLFFQVAPPTNKDN